jgi:hypothetical protein
MTADWRYVAVRRDTWVHNPSIYHPMRRVAHLCNNTCTQGALNDTFITDHEPLRHIPLHHAGTLPNTKGQTPKRESKATSKNSVGSSRYIVYSRECVALQERNYEPIPPVFEKPPQIRHENRTRRRCPKKYESNGNQNQTLTPFKESSDQYGSDHEPKRCDRIHRSRERRLPCRPTSRWWTRVRRPPESRPRHRRIRRRRRHTTSRRRLFRQCE